MLSKRRAAAMVIAGMTFTWPAQLYLGAVKSTETFADADTEYVLATWAWVAFVCVSASIGFGLAYGSCVFLRPGCSDLGDGASRSCAGRIRRLTCTTPCGVTECSAICGNWLR